jgi:hypothetical protein
VDGQVEQLCVCQPVAPTLTHLLHHLWMGRWNEYPSAEYHGTDRWVLALALALVLVLVLLPLLPLLPLGQPKQLKSIPFWLWSVLLRPGGNRHCKTRELMMLVRVLLAVRVTVPVRLLVVVVLQLPRTAEAAVMAVPPAAAAAAAAAAVAAAAVVEAAAVCSAAACSAVVVAVDVAAAAAGGGIAPTVSASS